jgi:predicted AlkP superfamily pyrophosphatase or phosphodiesterase
MKNIISIALLVSTILLCKDQTKNKEYSDAIERSLLPNIDLILIPNPYNYLDDEWILERKPSHYTKSQLVSQLKRYGNSWEKFEKKYKDQLVINGESVVLNGKGITHSTNHLYDRNIPIVFYGNKYISPGIYEDIIYQQNITPTLAHIIDSPLPKGSIDKPINKILNPSNKNQKPPEIIFVIVIDQGGMELFKAQKGNYPNIQKLFDNGAFFPNAEVAHIDAHTAVGHVSIGTGAFPKVHTIIANEKAYPLADGKIKELPIYEDFNSKITTQEIAAETLADVWDLHRNNKPVIISQCYAMRASIGMAGHGAEFQNQNDSIKADKDFVYWLTKKDLSWLTASNIFSLPKAVENYSLFKYLANTSSHPFWPEAHQSKEDIQKNFYKLVGNPLQSRLEGEMVRSVVSSEIIDKNLHKDGETDLVYVTFKAVDATGHSHGWESEESGLVLKETDKQVGEIVKFLENNFNDSFLLVLTADHGAGPKMEFSGGSFYSYEALIKTIQTLLPESARLTENLVFFYTTGQISLNKDVMKKYGISTFQIKKKIESIQVDGKFFFKSVLTRSEMHQ